MAERYVPVVFLEGDPGYYSRPGFAAGTEQGLRKPSLRIPDPAFQSIRLPAYRPWMTGTLVYSETFWRHDVVGLREPNAWTSRSSNPYREWCRYPRASRSLFRKACPW